MTINFKTPELPPVPQLSPRITVIGVGGAGGNAVNNMIQEHLEGVDFVVANTDAQALAQAKTDRHIQLGTTLTGGLGAGSRPDVGRAAAEENIQDILNEIQGSHMVFITAGMGGGTGTGAAPVIAHAARESGILTVGVVTKPFQFEGVHRMRLAEQGIEELQKYVDTLIVIPNQNLFRIANEKTTFAQAFTMADQVLHSGVRGVTDLMVMPGLINLDFADIKTVMSEMGKAMMGTGEADGERRALDAAERAISNPLLDDTSMRGAKGVLINITGGSDMTLFEVDEAANRIREEVDTDANIIFGSTFDESMDGRMRVSVVATGIEVVSAEMPAPKVLEVRDAQAAQPAVKEAAPAEATGSASVITMARPEAKPTISPFPGRDSQADMRAPVREVQEQPRSATQSAQDVAERVRATLGAASQASAAPASRDTSAFIPPAPQRVEQARTPLSATAPFGASSQAAQPAAQPALGEDHNDGARAQQGGLFARIAKGAAAKVNEARKPALSPMQNHGNAQPSFDMIPSERPTTASQAEDDLLDIPSFLRRQAN